MKLYLNPPNYVHSVVIIYAQENLSLTVLFDITTR
jgi:hypothetical protein